MRSGTSAAEAAIEKQAANRSAESAAPPKIDRQTEFSRSLLEKCSRSWQIHSALAIDPATGGLTWVSGSPFADTHGGVFHVEHDAVHCVCINLYA